MTQFKAREGERERERALMTELNNKLMKSALSISNKK